jgi:hypothetical protein
MQSNLLRAPVRVDVTFMAMPGRSAIRHPPTAPVKERAEAEYGESLHSGLNYRVVMELLVAALNLRDDDTDSHARRVTYLGLWITRRVDPALADDPALAYAFLLHDIGKIGVPDTILRKTGALSSRERRIVRRHTILGERLLNLIPSLPTLVHDVVAYHHERWDGTGYPHGLQGNEIPLAARIFAVADAYDAITNDRPYRTELPASAATEELRACAGTHFDPDVVEMCFGTRVQPPTIRLADESRPPAGPGAGEQLRSTFLTNHALVLTCIAQDRDAGVRTIAERVGITERATHSILRDLVSDGYLERTRLGRRNRYRVTQSAPLGYGFTSPITLGDFVDALLPELNDRGSRATRRPAPAGRNPPSAG